MLREVRRLPDGRFDIVTRGARRFRLLDRRRRVAPYLMGSVEFLPDTPAATPASATAIDPMLAAAARGRYRRYCQAAWKQGDWAEPADDIEPAELPHLLAADCLLPMEDRQRLLEETRPLHRLRLVGSDARPGGRASSPRSRAVPAHTDRAAHRHARHELAR